MEINYKKNHLSRVRIFLMILLFAMCLTTNVLFCGKYNLYELSDKASAIETWTISESIITVEESNNTNYFNKPLFWNNNNSHTEIITKNICPIPIIVAISKGFSLFLFLTIVFIYFFLSLFILLPDEWTLINQKIRLDI